MLAVPRNRELNTEVARIVDQVLNGMSLGMAAQHLRHNPGKEGVRALKAGKIGWETTPRAFAAGFADRFCELYGDQIRSRFGECNAETAADWFAEKAGFAVHRGQEAAVGTDPEEDRLRRLIREENDRLRQELTARLEAALGKHESLQDQLFRRYTELLRRAGEQGRTVPTLAVPDGGWANVTQDWVDQEIASLTRRAFGDEPPPEPPPHPLDL